MNAPLAMFEANLSTDTYQKAKPFANCKNEFFYSRDVKWRQYLLTIYFFIVWRPLLYSLSVDIVKQTIINFIYLLFPVTW